MTHVAITFMLLAAFASCYRLFEALGDPVAGLAGLGLYAMGVVSGILLWHLHLKPHHDRPDEP